MIKLIAAVSKNGVIGKGSELIFRDKEDMKHFRETTIGKGDNIVVMGRKTWDSIPEAYRPFKDRTNFVLTSQPQKNFPKEVFVVRTIREMLIKTLGYDVFIIGGGEIYSQTIDIADELLISEFPKFAAGNVFFPEIDLKVWELKEEKPFEKFTLKTYRRK